MLLRPFLYDPASCASYLFGCGTHSKLAVVNPLVELTHASAYLPAGAGVDFEHVALADGDTVELGNTVVTAIATPGHAPAHHAYAVADRRRGTEQPWLVFTGDSPLVGDVGRPDLHVSGGERDQAEVLHASLRRLLELPDHVVVY